MMKSKDKAVTVLTKGVEFLLKKIKSHILKDMEALSQKMKLILKMLITKKQQLTQIT